MQRCTWFYLGFPLAEGAADNTDGIDGGDGGLGGVGGAGDEHGADNGGDNFHHACGDGHMILADVVVLSFRLLSLASSGCFQHRCKLRILLKANVLVAPILAGVVCAPFLFAFVGLLCFVAFLQWFGWCCALSP